MTNFDTPSIINIYLQNPLSYNKKSYLCSMNIFALILFICIIVGLAYLSIKLPTIKGRLGEKSVASTLSFLPREEYITLNDVMFKNGEYSTQIDHIVISTHGIFVIETKNYKGWIFGNSNKDKWVQNIWGNKYSLYNPIMQNQNHIKFLLRKFECLREKTEYIYPVIVFLSASKLQLSGDCDCVLWRSELNGYIKSCRQEVLTINECKNIAERLSEENIADKKEREIHNIKARKAVASHEYKIAHGICPICGGRLALRIGRYGQFYGCSNYPRCKYTR